MSSSAKFDGSLAVDHGAQGHGRSENAALVVQKMPQLPSELTRAERRAA